MTRNEIEMILKFKPCPFCSNNLLYLTDRELFEDMVQKTGSFCISINCEKCDVIMYVNRQKHYDSGVRQLMEKWNKRGEKDETEDK